MTAQPPGTRTVVLDNNVWSYLASKSSDVRLIEKVAKQGSWMLLTPPSILLEALRRPRARERRATVKAMSIGPRRRRIRPEIALEVDDLIALVTRHVPGLLRPTPDRLRRSVLDDYWTRGIWTEVARDDRHSHKNQVLAASKRSSFVASSRENKTALSKIGFGGQLDSLTHLADEKAPPSYLLGWDGSAREMWRVQLRDQWFRALIWNDHRNDRSAELYREWASCHLDLEAIAKTGPALTDLFLSTARPVDLPHAWFRWAVNMAQETRKIGSGNAVDNQHSAYLPNADLFITTDRRMADALAHASAQTPFPVARTLLATVKPLDTFAERVAAHLLDHGIPGPK